MNTKDQVLEHLIMHKDNIRHITTISNAPNKGNEIITIIITGLPEQELLPDVKFIRDYSV